MKVSCKHKLYFFLLLTLLIEGCASLSGWETESVTDDFVDGTVVLGEVVRITTREEALNRGGYFEGWRDKFISAGYSDEDIVDGGQTTIWTYCFAHNSGVNWCRHSGYYVAYIPPEFRKKLRGESQYTNGDLVAVSLIKTETGYLVGEIIGIYRKSGDWKNCHMASYEPLTSWYPVVSTLMMVGPPQAAWIECEMDKNDGWQRRPVSGAPISARTPVSEWVKDPGVAAKTNLYLPPSAFGNQPEESSFGHDISGTCGRADLGYVDAQSVIGDVFYIGLYGIKKDPVQAYVWYSLAANKTGGYASEYAANQLDTLRRQLTPEQMTEAMHRLEDWKPGQCESDLVLKK